ncbi:universal stress protein [Cellulomonas timonensis]|uniref:universal stress protein n=1 Tax=Cellulomonas timonensis TaxID=1689271 RepID=UPI000834EBA5|nr:universal stress protein [Cellulomonas timonensis]
MDDATGPVVIAVDGSPHSARTLAWGADEAALRGAAALVVCAYQEPQELTGWGWYPYVPDGVSFDAEARESLAGAVRVARERRPGLDVEGRLLHGPTVPTLLGVSAEAQLLVVGGGERGPRLPLGSVVSHVTAHAECPVAVVRGAAPDDASGPVVVGVDGSRASLAAASTASREAAPRGVPLVVVHARPPIAEPYGRGVRPPPVTGDEAVPDDPAHRRVSQVADDLRAAQPALRVEVVLLDDAPAHALLSAAPEAQLVVVGSRGLGSFRGMLLGSVSNEVVRRAATTVLVSRGAVPASTPGAAGG